MQLQSPQGDLWVVLPRLRDRDEVQRYIVEHLPERLPGEYIQFLGALHQTLAPALATPASSTAR